MEMLESYKALPSNRPPLFPVSFIVTAIRNSAGYPNYAVCSSYKKYCDNLTNMYFSARWLARADVHNGDILGPTEVESRFVILE